MYMESSKQSRSYYIIQYLKYVMSAYTIRSIYFAHYHYRLGMSYFFGVVIVKVKVFLDCG
jgi:hypothetical protein